MSKPVFREVAKSLRADWKQAANYMRRRTRESATAHEIADEIEAGKHLDEPERLLPLEKPVPGEEVGLFFNPDGTPVEG